MPRYHFDLQDFRDQVGVDLEDEASARQYALRLAGDLIRDTSLDAGTRHYWRMDVRLGDERCLTSLVLEMLPAGPNDPAATDQAVNRAGGPAPN